MGALPSGWLRGLGGAAFGTPAGLDLGPEPFDPLAAGDADGDGVLDLVAGSRTYAEVVLRSGARRGALVSRFAMPDRLRELTLGDVDGDGLPDIIGSFDDGQVCVVLHR